MIKLIDLNKVFTTDAIETQALKNVNLEIQKGEFVSIMGPSGCGKSTLLNIIGLLDLPTSGKIIIDGQEIVNVNDKKLAKLRNEKLGFIFQSFHLIPALDVIDNVTLPLLYRNNIPEKERKALAVKVLDRVGLSHRVNHYPSQLSGGQCQRVAIARALIGQPSILLADEPTGNLDSKMSKEIISLLKELNEEGMTILMVTHDENIAGQTTRIINILDGELKGY